MSGNVVAVILIPFVGNLSDRIGRRPVIIVGCLGSGILAYPYLYFVSQGNLADGVPVRHPDVGRRLPGLQRGLPVVLSRSCSRPRPGSPAFAVSQNIGTLITAFLPAIYAALAGPTPGACVVNKKFAPDGSCRRARPAGRRPTPIEGRVIWTVGSITFGLAIIAAIAAFFARETFRIHLNDLGKKDAVPVPKEEYDRIRTEAKALVST